MWLILTVLCALVAYGAVLYFQSLIPALVFLAGAAVFGVMMWRKGGRKL